MGFLKKEIKTSTGLIVVFAAAVLLVGGALAYWYYNDPNSYSTSTDATAVATTIISNTNTASETADWKTYTNTTYGFSFKYPTDWTVEKSNETSTNLSLSLLSPTDKANLATPSDQQVGMRITAGVLNSTTTFDKVISDIQTLEGKKTTDATIGNNLSSKFIHNEGLGNGVYSYYVKNPNGQSYIEFGFFEENAVSKNSIFNLITKSFVFTNPTADWKNYTNSTYGFSFKYPTDWTINSDKLVTTDPNARKQLDFATTNNGTAQVLINFEGGFEGASYYRKGEAKNYLLNITKKEDWTQDNPDGKQIVLFTEEFNVNKDSLYLIYNYKSSNELAVNLFDNMLSTFQFTK